MEELLKLNLSRIFTVERLTVLLQIGLIMLVGLILIKLLSRFTLKILKKRITPQTTLIIRKAYLYGGLAIIIITVLNKLGISLTPLLGAAGIAGIAVGFASQTSIANLISGLFLISEKPFAIGDVISVGNITGVIISIDLLSVKIRTFDNLFIRYPNEKILNNELTNITRFPIRRMDLDLAVAYKEDMKKVWAVLLEIAGNNPYCLDEPEPVLVYKNFGAYAQEFLFGIWFYKTDFLNLKNSIMQEIKTRFDQEGIEIPYPHQVISTQQTAAPFPVRIVEGGEGQGKG